MQLCCMMGKGAPPMSTVEGAVCTAYIYHGKSPLCQCRFKMRKMSSVKSRSEEKTPSCFGGRQNPAFAKDGITINLPITINSSVGSIEVPFGPLNPKNTLPTRPVRTIPRHLWHDNSTTVKFVLGDLFLLLFIDCLGIAEASKNIVVVSLVFGSVFGLWDIWIQRLIRVLAGLCCSCKTIRVSMGFGHYLP